MPRIQSSHIILAEAGDPDAIAELEQTARELDHGPELARALLAQPPHPGRFTELCWLFDDWPGPGEAEPWIAMAYSRLRHWPDHMRLAPKEWTHRLLRGDSRPAAWHLARTVVLLDYDLDDEAIPQLVQGRTGRSLSILSLRTNNIGDAGFQTIAASADLSRLHTLEIDGQGYGVLTDEGIQCLLDSALIRRLRRVVGLPIPKSSIGFLLRKLAGGPVQELQLAGRVPPGSFEGIQLPRLRRIQARLSAEDVRLLLDPVHFPQLQHIAVEGEHLLGEIELPDSPDIARFSVIKNVPVDERSPGRSHWSLPMRLSIAQNAPDDPWLESVLRGQTDRFAPLLRLLSHDDAAVRQLAIEKLALCPELAEREDWWSLLVTTHAADADFHVRKAAGEAILDEPNALPKSCLDEFLGTLLYEPVDTLRQLVCEAAGTLSRTQRQRLREALADAFECEPYEHMRRILWHGAFTSLVERRDLSATVELLAERLSADETAAATMLIEALGERADFAATNVLWTSLRAAVLSGKTPADEALTDVFMQRLEPGGTSASGHRLP